MTFHKEMSRSIMQLFRRILIIIQKNEVFLYIGDIISSYVIFLIFWFYRKILNYNNI